MPDRFEEEAFQLLTRRHSERFRKVSTRYPRRVAEAYEGDLTRAMTDSDDKVNTPRSRPGRGVRASKSPTGLLSASRSGRSEGRTLPFVKSRVTAHSR